MSGEAQPRRTLDAPPRRQETYKHLEDPLRPGGLTLGQWATLVASALGAILFGLYVSPLPAGPTISISLFLAGLPAGVSYAAGGFDLSIADSTRAIWRWARSDKHYLPGPGTPAAGYVVIQRDDAPAQARGQDDPRTARRRLENAWDR